MCWFSIVLGFVGLLGLGLVMVLRSMRLPGVRFARVGALASAGALDELLRRYSREGVSFRAVSRNPWMLGNWRIQESRGLVDVYVRGDDLSRAQRIWDECAREAEAAVYAAN